MSRAPDEHGNPFGCEYSLRFDGDHKYHDFVTAECFHRLERELTEYEGGKNGDIPPEDFSEVGKRNWRIGYWMERAKQAEAALSATRESVIEACARAVEDAGGDNEQYHAEAVRKLSYVVEKPRG